MKTRTLIQAVFVAALVAAPALSYAQSVDQNNAPKTRAEVRAELVQIEQAGYNPATADDATYPRDIQAAEARVSQEQGVAQTQPAANTGYGGASMGSSQSGAQPQTVAPSQRVYFGN